MVLWFFTYKEIKAEKTATAKAVVKIPWMELIKNRTVLGLIMCKFFQDYLFYLFVTWLPAYLIGELGFSALRGGLFAALPFLLAGIADVAGGWLTDRLARTRGLRVARCGLGAAAFSTSAALVMGSTVAADPVTKAILLACAMGSADLSLSACWAAPLDIAVAHAGVVTGFMNTFGNIGGFLCPIVVGWAVDRLHSWTVPFYIAAAVYAVGAIAWLAVDPEQTIDTRSA